MSFIADPTHEDWVEPGPCPQPMGIHTEVYDRREIFHILQSLPALAGCIVTEITFNRIADDGEFYNSNEAYRRKVDQGPGWLTIYTGRPDRRLECEIGSVHTDADGIRRFHFTGGLVER